MNTESQDQQLLIKWFDLQYPKVQPPLFAVPNAGKMPVWVGARFNREGRRKGAPDLLLLVPRGGFNGLAIEMKILKGGKVSPEQTEFLNALAENNYMSVVCKGFEQAKETITAYLAY
jgi:hypothetical protein